jgi:hypothetical protein
VKNVGDSLDWKNQLRDDVNNLTPLKTDREMPDDEEMLNNKVL